MFRLHYNIYRNFFCEAFHCFDCSLKPLIGFMAFILIIQMFVTSERFNNKGPTISNTFTGKNKIQFKHSFSLSFLEYSNQAEYYSNRLILIFFKPKNESWITFLSLNI